MGAIGIKDGGGDDGVVFSRLSGDHIATEAEKTEMNKERWGKWKRVNLLIGRVVDMEAMGGEWMF